MIRFLYKKFMPTAVMTMTSLACYSMESVTTDPSVTPAVTPASPTEPATPSTSTTPSASYQNFVNDLSIWTKEVNNIESMVGTGCLWAESTTQTLVTEISAALVQVSQTVIPTAITDLQTLVTVLQTCSAEAQQFVALFTQISSIVKKTGVKKSGSAALSSPIAHDLLKSTLPVVSSYTSATSKKSKEMAKSGPHGTKELLHLLKKAILDVKNRAELETKSKTPDKGKL